MRNFIDIDYMHSRAIVREIGERLRASLKPEPELPASLKMQIDRLRKLEEQSPSIVPGKSLPSQPTLDRRRRCPACAAMPQLAHKLVDPRTGNIVRVYQCQCDEIIWDD